MGKKKKNARKKNQAQNRRRQSESNANTSNGNDCREVNLSSAPFGLANLGNTCYFNSALQVMSRTPLLVHLLHSKCNERATWAGVHRDELVKPPITIENGTNTEDEASDDELEQESASWTSKMPKMSLVLSGELTVAFFEVMKEMQSPRTGTKRVVTPCRLRNALGRKSRQFCDREEQDSHELLRTLLDLIRSDEIRRHRLAVYDWLKIPREPSKQHNVDDDTKALVKAHGPSCNFTTVDVLFSGYLLSSIACHECGNTTQIIEQMFDLSVPVSEAKLPHDHVKKQYSNHSNLNSSNTSSKPSPVNCVENSNINDAGSPDRSDGENSSTKANVDLDDLDALVSDDVADLADVEDAQDSDDQDRSRGDDISLSDSSKLKNNELEDVKDLMNKLNVESNDSPVPECDTDTHLMSPSPLLQNEVTGNNTQAESNQVNGHEHWASDLVNRKCLINWSLRTVAQFTPRKSQSGNSPTLEACLSSFTQPELLTGSNKLFCENCTKLAKEKKSKPSPSCNGSRQQSQQKQQTGEKQFKVYSNASKHFLIAYPPLILTIHLKRFHVEGYGNVNLRKINRHVDFPLVLDLSPWVSQVYREIGKFMGVNEDSADSTLKYRLYGLVEHSGTLRGGHYTSKIRVDCNFKGKKTLSTDSKYLRMRPFIPSFDTFLKHLDPSVIYNNNETTTKNQSSVLEPTSPGQETTTTITAVNNDEVSSSHSSSTPDDCNEHNNASSQSTSNQSPTTGNSQWYHCCDSNVRPVTLNDVLSSQAYLLFYERI